jgi:Uma2 family endonuclease
MGMGATEPIYYTADMVRALNARSPDFYVPRYETVHGELLVMRNAPRPLHQRVVARLLHRLATYLDREPAGEAFTSPAELSWGLDDVLVQPDVFVVPPSVSRAIDGSASWDAVRELSLVVEVLSPTTTRHDRFAKRRLYQERGVPLYWIVDADTRVVEVWTPADTFPRFERERLAWHPDGAAAAFSMPLDELFGD